MVASDRYVRRIFEEMGNDESYEEDRMGYGKMLGVSS